MVVRNGGGASDGGDGGGMSHLAPLMYSPKYFPVVPFLASHGSIYSKYQRWYAPFLSCKSVSAPASHRNSIIGRAPERAARMIACNKDEWCSVVLCG